ncbi:hypothetical protein LCGC14_2864680 [marine sediment metagenome]|uniref:Uncharacterized protein n=1 Tax=marine sediment metagenome TaxID=412755 RepID=A0A0F9AVS7_9ZZZZ
MKQSALENYMKVAQYEYSFAKHGGATGEITVGPKLLPKGAKIFQGFIDVSTAVTSGASATIQLKVTGADDILASTGKASFSLAALLDVVPVGTAATMVIVAAAANLTVTVGTADLTAGVFTVNLFYVITE